MKIFRVWLLVLLLGCRTGGYEGPPSDHFDGERFFQLSERPTASILEASTQENKECPLHPGFYF